MCTLCEQEKSLEEFHRRANTNGHWPYCKSCALRRQREWRKSNREKANQIQRDYRARNPEKERIRLRRQRLKRYGLTPEQYDEMLKDQDEKCTVCGTTEPGVGDNLYVDHDHQTGSVRGLLCHDCNSALGHAKDDVERLMALAAYLLKSRSLADYQA